MSLETLKERRFQMFTLKKDIPQLYQWDSNVKLIVEDDRINQVQFSQRFSRTAACVKVENRECFIPNEFLQSYYDIFCLCMYSG